jgi:hypothetical protein
VTVFLVVPTLAVLAGCGHVVVVPVAQDDFADAYAAAECSALAGCCTADGLLPGSACTSAVRAEIEVALDGATSAGAVYDPRTARACIDAIGAFFAACDVKLGPVQLPTVCSQVFTNKTTPPGAPCTSKWQCADGPSAEGACISSTSASGTIPPRCEQIVWLAEGADCRQSMPPPNTQRWCAASLVCNDELGGTCEKRTLLGEPCVAAVELGMGDDCAMGLVCDLFASKTCVPAKKAGDACTAIDQCQDFGCWASATAGVGIPPGEVGTCQSLTSGWFPFACQAP